MDNSFDESLDDASSIECGNRNTLNGSSDHVSSVRIDSILQHIFVRTSTIKVFKIVNDDQLKMHNDDSKITV